MKRIITFTSDFGLDDPYVGIVHGVIASIDPSLHVIDLTHGIPPHNIAAGAIALFTSIPYFPQGTVHLAVVDPGVGTTRRAVCIQTASGYFVGPDNGLFSLVAPVDRQLGCWEISQSPVRRTPSATFHGRDIFAPVGAHLAAGRPPEELGTATTPALPRTELTIEPMVFGTHTGRILVVDHFGNMVSNCCITSEWLTAMEHGTISAWLEGQPLRVVRTYGDIAPGEVAVLAGSSGLLEVAAHHRSAAALTGLSVGCHLRIAVNG